MQNLEAFEMSFTDNLKSFALLIYLFCLRLGVNDDAQPHSLSKYLFKMMK